MLASSTIEPFKVDGRAFLLKRDDLYHPYLSGNKYRKLHTLLHMPKEQLRKIISYGGTQSNAMLAIASLCQQKGWEFEYYSKPMSQTQKQQGDSNYALACSLGMKHIEIEQEHYQDYIASLGLNLDESSFIVDQGGATKEAKEGIEVLAQEIREQAPHAKSLATPSGTGTTALFLACSLPEYRVYTTPCVGGAEYLKEQMLALVGELPKNLVILDSEKKYHFAKPYEEFYTLYKKLLACGVEFDLLYAPKMWKMLLEQTSEEVLYIHSGGVSGNTSMLARYQRKFEIR